MAHDIATDQALALLGTGPLSRATIDRIQAVIGRCPQENIPPRHCLAGGIYTRTIFIPAGTVLIGASTRPSISRSASVT